MIQLTDMNGNKITFNVDQITFFYQDGNYTKIMINSRNSSVDVVEPYTEVTRKILEYKLAMVSFSTTMHATMSEKEVNHLTDLADSAVELNDQLFRLAGLEVSHDPT